MKTTEMLTETPLEQGNVYIIITSADEVMFLPPFIFLFRPMCLFIYLFMCLFACEQHNSKTYAPILMKFSG